MRLVKFGGKYINTDYIMDITPCLKGSHGWCGIHLGTTEDMLAEEFETDDQVSERFMELLNYMGARVKCTGGVPE